MSQIIKGCNKKIVQKETQQNDLQLYPYGIRIKKTLTQNDMAKRV